jgi:hypothetical protein
MGRRVQHLVSVCSRKADFADGFTILLLAVGRTALQCAVQHARSDVTRRILEVIAQHSRLIIHADLEISLNL